MVPLPDAQAGFRTTTTWTYGVGSGYVRDRDGRDVLRASKGMDIVWVAADAATIPSHDLFNTLDPADVDSREPQVISGNGRLSIAGDLPLMLNLSFFDDGTKPLSLKLVRPGARPVRRAIDKIPEPLRLQMLMDHVRPIPVTLERHLLSFVDPFFAGGQEPRLGSRLRAWEGAGKAQKRVLRPLIAKDLMFGCADPWRTHLIDRFALHAGVNRLSLGSTTRSYAEWLGLVVAEDVEDGGKDEAALRPFAVFGDPGFVYTLEFSDLGVQRSAPDVSIGAYAVAVTVNKERAELLRDKVGHIVYNEMGVPVVSQRTPVAWRNSGLLGNKMIGLFARIDAGFSPSVNSEGFQPPKMKPATATGTADLGKVEFVTTLDLPDLKEFQGAVFTTASIVLGKASFGNWAKGQLADSTLWRLRLANGLWMTSVVEPSSPVRGPKISNWGSVATKKWRGDWKPDALNITAARIGMGAGALVPLDVVSGQPPTRPGTTQRDLPVNLAGGIAAKFAYASADLDAASPGLISRRMRFELQVAEVQSLFVVDGPPAVMLGLTSPEGGAEYNMVLATDRILATDQALRDCLGELLTRSASHRYPRGKGPSLLAGLVVLPEGITLEGGNLGPDPALSSSKAAYLARYGAQASKWPDWRRVDVYVEGHLLVQVRADPPNDSP